MPETLRTTHRIASACKSRRAARFSGMETSQAGAIAGELKADFAAAWNQHAMQALGSLFHQDAAFVNVTGAYMHGRQEIERAQPPMRGHSGTRP